MLGMFAVSRAGHDKDCLYIIVKEETEYVYVVDGRNKKVEKPKRKNKKHIQVIRKNADEQIVEKLLHNQTLSNEEVKRAVLIREKELRSKLAGEKKQEVSHVKS